MASIGGSFLSLEALRELQSIDPTLDAVFNPVTCRWLIVQDRRRVPGAPPHEVWQPVRPDSALNGVPVTDENGFTPYEVEVICEAKGQPCEASVGFIRRALVLNGRRVGDWKANKRRRQEQMDAIREQKRKDDAAWQREWGKYAYSRAGVERKQVDFGGRRMRCSRETSRALEAQLAP